MESCYSEIGTYHRRNLYYTSKIELYQREMFAMMKKRDGKELHEALEFYIARIDIAGDFLHV